MAEAQFSEDLGGLTIPYLGAEDVIEEVVVLLARLECDRQDIQTRMYAELGAADHLRQKTEALCLRRLQEMPVLVQKGR